MKERVDFKQLAKAFMFSDQNTIVILTEFKLQYRKNKTVVDLVKAKRKALKNGMGKTEYELGMLEIYLKDVFKLTEKENKIEI